MKSLNHFYSHLSQVMQQLETSQAEWYTRLVAPLSENDKKSLQEVFTLANQRRNARESKNIEQAGGKPKVDLSFYYFCDEELLIQLLYHIILLTSYFRLPI